MEQGNGKKNKTRCWQLDCESQMALSPQADILVGWVPSPPWKLSPEGRSGSLTPANTATLPAFIKPEPGSCVLPTDLGYKGILQKLASFFMELNVHTWLRNQERIQGTIEQLQVQLLFHTNKVNVSQPISNNMCELQDGCSSTRPTTCQISQEFSLQLTLIWNIQQREFREMYCTLAKLAYHKAITVSNSRKRTWGKREDKNERNQEEMRQMTAQFTPLQ